MSTWPIMFLTILFQLPKRRIVTRHGKTDWSSVYIPDQLRFYIIIDFKHKYFLFSLLFFEIFKVCMCKIAKNENDKTDPVYQKYDA